MNKFRISWRKMALRIWWEEYNKVNQNIDNNVASSKKTLFKTKITKSFQILVKTSLF